MKLRLKLAVISGSVWMAAAAHAVVLTPIADTRILSYNANNNFGSDVITSTYNNGTDNNQRALYLFDYSSLAGQTVISAKLQLYGFPFFGSTASTSTYVYRPTAPWSELQTTWNQSVTGTPWAHPGGDFVGTTGMQELDPYFTLTGAQHGTGGNPDLYEFDVTSLVAGQVDGTWDNDGILLSGAVGNQLSFYTLDYNNTNWLPRMVIETSTVPEPSVILTVVGLSACLLRRRKK
ncbi:MAG: DNRLRE domain-containing protein [Armatimonadetes bacterium]|nr:DNRLRE domain-containing protein [Armatimonadota bacterium]